MADESPRIPAVSKIGKLKVRKGTQSCWQCKRRKIKCTFAAPTDTICQHCKRRGTRCISQEFPEDVGSNPKQLGDRLSRVEDLVERFLRDNRQDTEQEPSGPPAQARRLHRAAPSDTVRGP
ncbi:hypothetical protein TWF696_005664 [Orbilia brochopaga]|uniref:Zn(2)-C6 fungal-type domain-containing protein n=1 Tax=Orbilia brochopaga TaxID=3140254 RepID=A0AAV9V1T0_9PEZI